ncbi:MAG TPA: nuclear transport factor 2 family protein [Sphingomicrobium sp.]
MSYLTVAALGLSTAAASADRSGAPQPVLDELIKRNADANAALMRGDAKTFSELLPLADDFTLMSPMGGKVGRPPYSPEQMEEIGKFFKNGSFQQELVEAYATPDMVVLATIERANVEVGGLPPQEWPLRVTVVFRRDGAEWKLVHRHADPLVKGISVAQSAALARGEADGAVAAGDGVR